MEEKVEIKSSQGHSIKGILNWNSNHSNNLIIFVHGLNGSPNRHLFHSSSKYFPNQGFDTFRINLYDGDQEGRRLHELSITDHSFDIDEVVQFFKDTYEEIYLVGHSLGGPSILYSTQDVNGIVLWDPSLVLDKSQKPSWELDTQKNLYIIKGNSYSFGSIKMHDEWETSGLNMIENMKVRTKIICARNGPLLKRWEKVLDSIPVEYDFNIMEGANHSFDEEGCDEKLFEETLDWIKKN